MILFKNSTPSENELPLNVNIFAFQHDGKVVINPFAELDGVTPCLPDYYGFEIWPNGGTLWRYGLTLPDGGTLVITCDDNLPVLADYEEMPELVNIGRYDANGDPVAIASLSEYPHVESQNL